MGTGQCTLFFVQENDWVGVTVYSSRRVCTSRVGGRIRYCFAHERIPRGVCIFASKRTTTQDRIGFSVTFLSVRVKSIDKLSIKGTVQGGGPGVIFVIIATFSGCLSSTLSLGILQFLRGPVGDRELCTNVSHTVSALGSAAMNFCLHSNSVSCGGVLLYSVVVVRASEHEAGICASTRIFHAGGALSR